MSKKKKIKKPIKVKGKKNNIYFIPSDKVLEEANITDINWLSSLIPKPN